MRSIKISIHQAFLIGLALVGLISVSIVGYLWIRSERSMFATEAQVLRESFLESQKESLKREVHRAVDFIAFMQSQTEQRLKEEVKSRVYEAHSIAENTYRQHQGDKKIAEIETHIREILRPMRFNNGRGYYFAFNLQGVETLFPIQPELEGTSMLNVKGGNGERVVPDMLSLVREKGEGFYRYAWPKPNGEGYFPKIAFVKLVEPIGWVIGAGEYLDDVEQDIQQECLSWISSIKTGQADGYIFVGQYDGLSLSGPGKGQNMLAVEDANGIKIVQELIHAAKNGGGFVHYVMPNLGEQKPAPKLSYAVGIPNWEWYIGSGVYIDEIEAALASKQLGLQERIDKNIRHTIIYLLALIIVIAILGKVISNGIGDNLKLFTSFFKRASKDTVSIDPNALHFTEFIQLAESANQMVAQRKQAEKDLNKSEAKYRQLFDQSYDAIFVVEKSTGRYLDANRAALQLTGYTLAELKTKTTSDLTPAGAQQRLKKIAALGNAHDLGEVVYVRADGTERISRLTVVPLDENTSYGIAHDITEQKQMDTRLQQAQKMESIGNLAAGIAHDFNNILFPIVGLSELLMEDLPPASRERENAREIHQAGKRGSALVHQILAFSRQSEHKMIPIRLPLVLNEVLNLSRATIPSNIEILTAVPSDCGLVMADPVQIHQVAMNLITNAYHAVEDTGGKITVTLTEHDSGKDGLPPPSMGSNRFVRLAITDTGPGITPEIMDRIFDPYFSTKEQGKGTGLGLAVVYGIVKEHHGDIHVYSDGVRGTTVQVDLPLMETAAAPIKPVNGELEPTGTERILLVDDEVPIVKLQKQMLERLGYRVTARSSSVDALEAFKSKPGAFDLVITDMAMPNMTGDQLARAIIAIQPGIPVVLCTGFSERINRRRATAMGIKGLLMKPILRAELAQTIRKVLDEDIVI